MCNRTGMEMLTVNINNYTMAQYSHYTRHGVIVIGNRNRLQSITDFLVIIIAISVLKHHIIVIAINYIAKVITIFMTATIIF